jgi:hypothetical protein
MNADSLRNRKMRATSSEKAVYSDYWGTVNRDCGTKPPLLGEEMKRNSQFFVIDPLV